MNTELRQKLDAYFAANEDALFADLAGLVAIKSVKSEPEEGAPYGRGSREALDYVLALGERDGFKTESCEGRVGFESYGEGEKYIASIAHVDVVPAGNGWNTDPFTMTEREGFVLGRGVLDDKGEAIISHWALKFLKDNDIPVRYETRVIFGANEEAGMDDMACYKAHYPEPAVAFVPDTSFPCEFAEKGGLRGVIRSGKILENIVSLCGGQAVNQVADRAEAVVRYDGELLPTEAVETEKTEDGLWRLVAHGVAKHACMPQHSVNAIGVLVKYLLANGVPAEKEQTYLKAILPLLTEIHGESFGLNVRDDVFPGSTTIVGCTIRTEDGELVQSFDSRYVTTLSGEKIAEALRKGVGCFEVIVERDVPVSSIDRSNPALRLCTEIYRSYRDDPSEPFASSGGTYARCFGNAFAFGPQYRNPGYPAFVGGLHMANEGVPKEQLILAAKIYAESFIALQELEY